MLLKPECRRRHRERPIFRRIPAARGNVLAAESVGLVNSDTKKANISMSRVICADLGR